MKKGLLTLLFLSLTSFAQERGTLESEFLKESNISFSHSKKESLADKISKERDLIQVSKDSKDFKGLRRHNQKLFVLISKLDSQKNLSEKEQSLLTSAKKELLSFILMEVNYYLTKGKDSLKQKHYKEALKSFNEVIKVASWTGSLTRYVFAKIKSAEAEKWKENILTYGDILYEKGVKILQRGELKTALIILEEASMNFENEKATTLITQEFLRIKEMNNARAKIEKISSEEKQKVINHEMRDFEILGLDCTLNTF